MKNIFRLSILFAFGLFVLASCAKRPPDNPGTSGTTNSMSGTFGGTKWTAATVVDSVSSGEIIMTGTSSTNSIVTIGIPANITAASYDQTTGIYQIEYYYDPTHYYFLTTGTLKIASNTGGVITGSFTGTFTNPSNMSTLDATAGSFTVKYQ